MGYIWPEEWPYHGTTNGYTSYMCRCEACKGAIREYRKSRRATNLENLRASGGVRTRGVKHGAAAYNENLCRCNECRSAATAQNAESRYRRVQRLAEEYENAQKVASRVPADALPAEFADGFADGFTDAPVSPREVGPMIGIYHLGMYEISTEAQRAELLYDQEDWEGVYRELQDRKMWLDYDEAKRMRHEWLRTYGAKSGQEGAGENLGLRDMPGYGLTRAEWLESQRTGGGPVPAGGDEDFTETNGGW